MDVSASCVNWLSVNDFTTNFIPGEVVFDPNYDEHDLDQFELSAWNYDEESGISTVAASIDNIVFCDATLPEPAILGLLLILLLFKRRR